MEKWKRERDPEKEPLGFKFKLIHEGFEKNFNDQLKDENLTFSQIKEKYEERIADRLIEMVVPIRFGNSSYRS